MLDFKFYQQDILNNIMNGVSALFIGIWIANIAYNTQPQDRRNDTLRSIAALAVSIVFAEAGKRYVIWPHDPTFPSGHETFASSVAASICTRDYRWTPFCVISCLALGWSMIKLHAHSPFELTGGFLLGSVVSALIMNLGKRKPAPNLSEQTSEGD